MRLLLDTALCDAHGQCVVVAPELFELGDDDDVAMIRDPHPGEHLRSKAQAAVNCCPMGAITLRSGEGSHLP